MKSLPIALLTALALAAPTSTAHAASDDEETLETLAEEMMHQAGPLRWFHVEHRLWEGINEDPQVVKMDEATRIIRKEVDDRYRNANRDHIWAMNWCVGLIPADCNIRETYEELLTEHLVAVYDYDAKRIKVVDRGDDAPPALARKLQLMHEVANSLDHKHVYSHNSRTALDDKVGRGHDPELALIALLDGSGRFLSKRYLHRAQKLKLIPRAETLQHTDYEEARGKRFLKLPPYFQAFLGAQVCGMRFLMGNKPPSAITDETITGQEQLELIGGNLNNLPKSTEQIIHPEKYLDPEKRDAPIDVEEGYQGKFLFAVPGWGCPYNRDTLGELLCAVLARPKDPKMSPMALTQPDYYTTEAASGWGGDRFFVLMKGAPRIPILGPGASGGDMEPENIRGVWVTVWDTPKDREEFVAAYDKNVPMPHRTTVRIGERTAAFLYGFEEDEAEKAAERMKQQPPRLRQDNKNVEP